MKGVGIILYCGLKATAGSQNAETLTGEVEHCLDGDSTRGRLLRTILPLQDIT